MKKKVETLLQSGRVAGQAEFEKLYEAYLTTKNSADEAKTVRELAKATYHESLGQDGTDADQHFELRTDFRKAKYLHQYLRADARLARRHLERWAEGFLMQEKAVKKAKKQGPGATSEKQAAVEQVATGPGRKRKAATAMATKPPKPTRTPGRPRKVRSEVPE